MTELVYTTSGFLIPKSPHYEVYEKNLSPLEQLYARSTTASADQAAQAFFKDNEIYTSLQANRLYLSYIDQPTYDNYIELVNFASDIFSQITCREFFEAQTASLHISPMSLLLCKDIITGKVLNYHQYAGIPPNSRFMVSNGFTQTKSHEQMKLMFKDIGTYGSLSWVDVLTPIVQNQGAFVTIFKHLFVDYY